MPCLFERKSFLFRRSLEASPPAIRCREASFDKISAFFSYKNDWIAVTSKCSDTRGD